ncbi:hypothetical protein DFH09DRAFT_1306637 [Mycena vulgaris]|nr:hypothetical protein DFH09DRAFT_1306637 [Mycena vulgaris]
MDSTVSLNLNTTIGALQIGVLISYVLLGVTTTQTYIYYCRFPNDSPKLKALVAAVWVCEMAHAFCVGHTLYVYTILGYAHPERLAGPLPASLDTALLLSSVIGVCVQGFFSFRIYTFSKKLHISILIWVMIFLRFVGSIVIFATALRMASLPQYEAQWGWLATAIWSVSAANDVVIAATLVVLLHAKRTDMLKRQGPSSRMGRTGPILDKLIAWTIETGVVTSVWNIATLACFVIMKKNLIWLAMFSINARLFSNSLLACLNSRAALRAMDEAPVSLSLPSRMGLSFRNVQNNTKGRQVAHTAEAPRGQSDKPTSEDISETC